MAVLHPDLDLDVELLGLGDHLVVLALLADLVLLHLEPTIPDLHRLHLVPAIAIPGPRSLLRHRLDPEQPVIESFGQHNSRPTAAINTWLALFERTDDNRVLRDIRHLQHTQRVQHTDGERHSARVGAGG